MISFDVFDTLITRNVATPEGVFAIMQEKIYHEDTFADLDIYVKNNFYEIRVNSENLARHIFARDGIQEITISQIYEIMALNCGFSKDVLFDLLALEKKIEVENVIGITPNIELLKRYVANGERVILITDMYLDIDTIKQMLLEVDNIFINIPVYLSSQYKKSKWGKLLFPIIKEAENIISYSEWTHYGDNVLSDIQNASSFGINAIHLPFEQLSECEKFVLDGKESDGAIQLHLGISRNSRLCHDLNSTMTIGSTIGGNILFPYVYWIIKESLKKEINRLYFVARDGYILKIIADKIIEKEKYPITTYYIYGSRRAWRMASFSGGAKEICDLIKVSYIERVHNLNDLAELFEIPKMEICSFLPGTDTYKDKELSSYFIVKILEMLSANERFAQYITEKQSVNRSLMRRYLQQEIVYSDDKFAFIELAGTGYTQKCLANVMTDFYDGRIRTFYFKMENIIKHENCENYVYFPSLLNMDLVVEMICRAPHGQTVGYKESRERIEPIFDNLEDSYLLNHGYKDYIEGIMKHTDTIISSFLYKEYSYFLRLNITVSIMKYIVNCPDTNMLAFFGDMPNSLTGREKRVILFAPKLSKSDIKNIFLLCHNESYTTYYNGSALEYSLLRCSQKEQKLIAFYKKNYNGLYGKVIRYIYKQKNALQKNKVLQLDDYGLIEKNVIIYAAGKRGKLLYDQLSKFHNYRIEMWIDKDFSYYRQQGLPVCAPEDIKQAKYDQVIIAVADKKMSEDIKADLMRLGVDKEKIIWIIPRKISL